MSIQGAIKKDKEILSSIAKNYNTLQYGPQLAEWLASIYPSKDITNLSKFELHKSLNDALINFYSGELQYKYSLFERFQGKKLVAGFEMRVKNSRVDFFTINGCTTSFEIKSTVDNLCRLPKQANDYISVFEYNNVVTDEKHVDNCRSKLPESFGIIVFKDQKLKTLRKAELNTDIKARSQLDLLTKKELLSHFKNTHSENILVNFKPVEVNALFKKALKERYKKRWDFVLNNSKLILPIDLQFFYNTQISPSTIYS